MYVVTSLLVLMGRVTRLDEFSICLIVYFGLFFEIFKSSTHFVPLIPRLRLYINIDKNGLGYILDDFFTNSSGHPASA
jgi:hypothetical protein